MEKQIIPVGYKLTEVGVIPDDWEDTVIGSVADFVGGSQPPKSTFKFMEAIGYIRLIQIRDYKKDTYITFIPENLAQKKCEAADIMIGRYGPPIFQILRGIKGAYNVALIKAIPNVKIEKNFLFYTLKSESLFQVMEFLSQRSSGQTGVDLPALKAYPLALPPLKEQTAIANALSDVDALINALEKLIHKKTAIKTAAMQQLLTGKKRLPPFDQLNTGYKQTELGGIPKDWEASEFGEYLDSCSSGATPYRGRTDFYRGTVRWISSGELNYNVIYDTNEKLSDEAVKKTNLKIHPEGTFLIAITGLEAAGTRGSCGFVGKPSATNQSCMALYTNNKLSNNYLFHYYVYKGDELAFKYCQGTKQQSYTAKLVKLLPIVLPKSIEEQTAIANVLSNMDTELNALQQRLAKTQQLKQGMMQELLTGKTRLV